MVLNRQPRSDARDTTDPGREIKEIFFFFLKDSVETKLFLFLKRKNQKIKKRAVGERKQSKIVNAAV